ncbi:MAG: AAA family ATPase [bacterium]
MSKISDFYQKSPLYSTLALESAFSKTKRRLISRITELIAFLSFILIVVFATSIKFSLIVKYQNILSVSITKLFGLFWVSVVIYILMHLFESYFSSILYFQKIANNKYRPEDLYTFSAGRILRRTIDDNILTGILRSKLGTRILLRLDIDKTDTNMLLMKQSEAQNPPVFNIANRENVLTVWEIFDFTFDNYPDFVKLLADHGIDKKMLKAAVDWSIYQIEIAEYKRQWWLPENLNRIPGVATDWSFGRTYLLSKYSREIMTAEEVVSDAYVFSGRDKELSQIQNILAKSSEANVILTGLPGQEKMQVIWSLCKNIRNRTVDIHLLDKKAVLFLANEFGSACADKNDFEIKLTKILNEVSMSGNVLLVIDNLPRLVMLAQQFGSELSEILTPYLVSPVVQIIALADIEPYHNLIEKNQSLMASFETIIIKPLERDEIAQIISREALEVENIYGIYYTYPAIVEITDDADYYFPDGVSSDKAEDILREITPWAKKNGFTTIGRKEVTKFIEEKTGVPLSTISLDEKNKLLDLENNLMKLVIAQREAIFSIASAIRRSRAGIRNPNRPIGSFLFLGPTGVGKTETAKTLAEVFFGGQKNMMRLDMSEYQDDNALERLIGSFENNKSGILADKLREQQYGVLLLDEFEKTNSKVLNLFLQILDEGYFSDAFGKKVNAKNIIFIATSNAGAEMIFDIVSKKENLEQAQDTIIASIISKGLLKPELINRFDGTIIFHPLNQENLIDIAKIMLDKLAKRLQEKGLRLITNGELIKYCAEHGYNPTFGARPMNRLIQNTVEENLADLIIRNKIAAGQSVEFSIVGNTGFKTDLKPIITN